MFCELVYLYLLDFYKYYDKSMNKYISVFEFCFYEFYFYVYDIVIMFVIDRVR